MTLKLVIDPGHGGSDTGTTGGGIIEKDYQLNIALKVKERLESAYDCEVILTRSTDTSVALAARPAVANALPDNPVFISFHHDAGSSPSARGGTIYVYGPKSWVKSTGAYAPNSFALAQKMLPIFTETLAAFGIPCNGVKDGDFSVLRNCQRRAVLLEAFFATNPTDAEIAKRPEFIEALVSGYVKMIATVLEIPKRKLGPFPDVPADAWYADAVSEMKELGVILGDAQGNFKPDQSVTRAEMAVLLRRLFNALNK